jgi:hypothetical protein
MSASEWTAIGIFVAGLVVSLLVYIVQFLHKMDKLEGDTGELKTRVTHLEANR